MYHNSLYNVKMYYLSIMKYEYFFSINKNFVLITLVSFVEIGVETSSGIIESDGISFSECILQRIVFVLLIINNLQTLEMVF